MFRCFTLALCIASFRYVAPATTPHGGHAAATVPVKSACDEPVYHVLDFWIGDWNVFDLTDSSKAGQSSIHKILNDCAIEVAWIGTEGEHVKELFYYYKPKRQWVQIWIGDGGTTKQRQLLERRADGSLRFQGEVAQMDGGSHLDRSTVTPLPTGRVHQVIETSKDGGKTWQLRFDADIASSSPPGADAPFHLKTRPACPSWIPVPGELCLSISMGSRIVVKSGKRTLFLRPEQIEWVEAERDHVRFHQGSETFLVRSSMSDLCRMLDSGRFMRVHRSTLVNLDHVREMRPLNSGDYEILMNNDVRLTMSRGYRSALQELLQASGAKEDRASKD